MLKNPDEQMALAYRTMSSTDINAATSALQHYAKSLEEPIRKAVFDCDNVGPFNIFEQRSFPDGCAEFVIDPIQPGYENDYKAYVVPDCSCLPCATLEADYVMVPMYEIGNCVEWCAKRVGRGNYNIVDRATEALRAGFVKKMNDDAWHVLLAAGVDRNVVAYDNLAAPLQLTKRLIVQMKTFMRRNGGGNSTCLNRSRLTDVFMSPEAMDDIYNWNIDQVPEDVRTEIHRSPNCDMGLTGLFCVRFHVLDELGVGQEYQTYYTSDLSGQLDAGKQEIVVGLDLSTRDSFVAPVGAPLTINADNTMLLSCRRSKLVGYMEIGFAALSSRRVLIAAI